jgi:tetratricopeptide (TPR) repeat protein
LYYKAFERDADFSAAYAAAAWCFCRRKASSWAIDREREIAEARRLARRAVQLGKDDATVLCDAGHALSYVAGELDDGAAFVDQALLINPNLGRGWAYSGLVKVWLGEPIRAIERFVHAMRLSPINPFIWFMQEGMAQAHFFAGRHDEAVLQSMQMLCETRACLNEGRLSGLYASADGQDQRSTRISVRKAKLENFLAVGSTHAWCARAARHSIIKASMFRWEIIKESSRVFKGLSVSCRLKRPSSVAINRWKS